jgi:hypothetical protein
MRSQITRRMVLIAVTATLCAVSATAGTAKAEPISPGQLKAAGWTCIQPGRFPTELLCFPPGVGLPPLPGTPGFADRLPSYELLAFDRGTGAFLGTQHALRPDIYEKGEPPCPQQPGGEYFYNAFNDLWICQRT